MFSFSIRAVRRTFLFCILFAFLIFLINNPTLGFSKTYRMGEDSAGYDTNDCAGSAGTMWAYKECMAVRSKLIDEKLNKVYRTIQKVYHENKTFLKALEDSQQTWSILCETNIAMQFPPPSSGNSYQDEYGSDVNACYMQLKEQCKLERIKFLEQWLIGSFKDVCSGSIMEESSLKDILGDLYSK